MKKVISIISLIFIFCTKSYSQTITGQEVDDFKAIVEAYISPLGNSLGSGLNNGWYNTAKPHKLGGFDITLTTNFVLINQDVKTFVIDEVVSDANSSIFSGGETPTILGNNDGATLNFSTGDQNGDPAITMPSGLKIRAIPLPVLQAGIGLIKNTELTFRYIPELKIGNAGKVGLMGFGIKHDVLQWLPIVNKVPIDISIQGGYTKVGSIITLEDPNDGGLDPFDANLDISATTFNLLLSKKLLMFTPYIGIGYSSTKTSFKVPGSTSKYIIGDQYVPTGLINEGFEFKSNNKIRANIGFRFNITIIALQANYTFSEYPIATIGVGLSVR